jgi:hypothetical protein
LEETLQITWSVSLFSGIRITAFINTKFAIYIAIKCKLFENGGYD